MMSRRRRAASCSTTMASSLFPREHGAYAQLAAPLVAAFVTFGVTLASALLAVGACLAFVANEPLLVVLGHRGKRAKDTHASRAKRWLAVLAPAAAVAGIAGLVLAPASRFAAALVGIVALVLLGFAWRKQERTFAGELVAAIALTGAAAPVAVAAGATTNHALGIWAAWAIGYALTVLAVHRVIARHKRPASRADAIAMVAAIAIIGAVVARALWIALPLATCALVLIVVAPSARHLRPIGFILVGASLISLAVQAVQY
jgi:hypothetical protein